MATTAPTIGLGLDRREYWRFLRRVYGMDALGAWNYIKRVGTPPSAEQVRAAIANHGAA